LDNTAGLLFQALCIRDLRIYADSFGGNVYHYRDAKRVEVDAIVQLNDGRWGAIEVKMGAGDIKTAADNLLKFKANIYRVKKNGFCCLLTIAKLLFLEYNANKKRRACSGKKMLTYRNILSIQGFPGIHH